MQPEEDRAMATGDLHKKFCEDQSSRSRDILVDRQTDTHTERDTHTQTDRNTRLPYMGGVINIKMLFTWLCVVMYCLCFV